MNIQSGVTLKQVINEEDEEAKKQAQATPEPRTEPRTEEEEKTFLTQVKLEQARKKFMETSQNELVDL
jgi:hypothetical protein